MTLFDLDQTLLQDNFQHVSLDFSLKDNLRRMNSVPIEENEDLC